MNSIHRSWWFNSFLIIILVSCTNNIKQNTPENPPTKETSIYEKEVKDSVSVLKINSIQKNSSTDTNKISKKYTQNVEYVRVPDPPIEQQMSETEYWNWRNSEFYYNDSVGQRINFKKIIDYKFPELDSSEFEKKWSSRWWNDYINKIEMNNVIWD